MTNSHDAVEHTPPHSGWPLHSDGRPRDLDLAVVLKTNVINSGRQFQQDLQAMSEFYALSAKAVGAHVQEIEQTK